MGKGSGAQAVLEIANLDALVVSFGIDADGEVLVLAFGGHVLRLVEAAEGYSGPQTITPRVTTPPVPNI